MFRRVLISPLILSSFMLTPASAATLQLFPFKALGTAGGVSGQLSVRTLSPTQSVSTLTLRGLTPGRAYAAHYHALGKASAEPCASQGPITLGFPAFKANARGQATILLRADPARIAGTLGAYVNVHTASDLTVVPLCAALVKTGAARGTPVAADSVTVKVGDNLFQPASLSVPAGTMVTWIHTGQITHNVLSLTVADLKSPDLRPGDRYSYTFKTPGTYTYYCSYHDGMSATITVTNR
ncbi:hypothetical protein E7T06_16975 [Deinococcus sp. Arct2-2]|uniref:cupredoxin domain-containing protein n=1 Tax=Deinococcus sp. Arct2-2 TaxID=2568653 RepID=UPI0010A31245|nr:plastocyanin/azurin family copper-binding protein [Deinococcus sp. Arct2-2]THF68352.1 hypothetical protein E7T06_16975 [Deinococcus sp. Arct2-2]